jgi:hypothetical protein
MWRRYSGTLARTAIDLAIAPMSLIGYQDARPWARAIKSVQSREMPPWYIDRNIGIQHFRRSVADRRGKSRRREVGRRRRAAGPWHMPAPRQFGDVDHGISGNPTSS